MSHGNLVDNPTGGTPRLRALDFFAGSGLATKGLGGHFDVVWANDISESKARVYKANHGAEHLEVAPIEDVEGQDLPEAELAWASFPCQDLSLAGNLGGIDGARSGLVWQWLRVLDEMERHPPLVVAENVLGLVTAARGANYRLLHESLEERGYRVGAVVLDGSHWVPQSRVRVFVVGVLKGIDVVGLEDHQPGWCHPNGVRRAARALPEHVWWGLPEPGPRTLRLEDIVDAGEPFHDAETRNRNLFRIPDRHWLRLVEGIQTGQWCFPGYRRMRGGEQVLELRFDGLAGCLRMPAGGSSRQLLVILQDNKLQTRLLTVSEAARLMGADGYRVPGTYNQGYGAMGDAVVVPAVEHLSTQLLVPLGLRATDGQTS